MLNTRLLCEIMCELYMRLTTDLFKPSILQAARQMQLSLVAA
jgi:hypothetical protein